MKPETLTYKYELDSLDQGSIRSIYIELSRETGEYGGPVTAFKSIMIFLAYEGYEIVKKMPQEPTGDR